ncbi:hypothetical protein ACWGID_22115 [Kribbella sp. NPDC054772]
MADADLTEVLGRINRAVLEELGGQSLATDEQLTRGVTRSGRPLLEALAAGNDAPRDDQRAAIRQQLTETVAHCANLRVPGPVTAQERDELLSTAEYEYNRDAFGVAMSRTWAQFATPRIAERLDAGLGEFGPPRLEADQETAWTITSTLGRQVGVPGEQMLDTVVAAGRGQMGAKAAEIVLSTKSGFDMLTAVERESAVLAVTDELEDGLAEPVGDIAPPQAALGLDPAGNPTDRGLAALGWANYIGAEEIKTLAELRAGDDGPAAANTQELARFLPGYDASATAPSRSDSGLTPRLATLPGVADQQFGELQAIVVDRLLTRVEHHSGMEPGVTAEQITSPAAAAAAAADAAVTMSDIPPASRPAAVAATATMLVEGLKDLPAQVEEWQARDADLRQEAAWYGASLGDQTHAAIKGFESRPPAGPGRDAAQRFLDDAAIPPLRAVHGSGGETRGAGDAARTGSTGSRRDGPSTHSL